MRLFRCASDTRRFHFLATVTIGRLLCRRSRRVAAAAIASVVVTVVMLPTKRMSSQCHMRGVRVQSSRRRHVHTFAFPRRSTTGTTMFICVKRRHITTSLFRLVEDTAIQLNLRVQLHLDASQLIKLQLLGFVRVALLNNNRILLFEFLIFLTPQIVQVSTQLLSLLFIVAVLHLQLHFQLFQFTDTFSQFRVLFQLFTVGKLQLLIRLFKRTQFTIKLFLEDSHPFIFLLLVLLLAFLNKLGQL
mmetsp:Transcript_24317/g.39136  ORF Transcript_24317/g.39136 Transcript_24317/m.39136 type:complete len:245 (-) Transcript_24317:96-830(-)